MAGIMDLRHLLIGEQEFRVNRFPTGLEKFDAGRAIPYHITWPQASKRQQHPERIGHGEQAAAEMGTDIIAIQQAASQPDPYITKAGIKFEHSDTGEQERRPQVDQPAKGGCAHHDFAETNQTLVGSCGSTCLSVLEKPALRNMAPAVSHPHMVPSPAPPCPSETGVQCTQEIG